MLFTYPINLLQRRLLMKLHKLLALISAATVIATCSGIKTSFAADDSFTVTNSKTADNSDTYSVNFIDFNGKIIATQNIKAGGLINFNDVDTSVIYKRIDKYTEMKFYCWDTPADTVVDKNITVSPLYIKATISIDSLPTKRIYTFKSGNIDLQGLLVKITFEKQLPSFDSSGKRLTETETVDISESCSTDITSIASAFASSDTATVNIYPPKTSISIGSYQIKYEKPVTKGDINEDGTVNAVDASMALDYYALIQSHSVSDWSDYKIQCADVDNSNFVDAIDASYILAYYADFSTTGTSTNWDSIIKGS